MLEFCPSCDNIYNFVQKKPTEGEGEDTLVLQCSSCNKENPFTGHCIKKKTQFGTVEEYKIVPEQCYDRTLPHTDSIKCQNSKCPSNTNPQNYTSDIVFFHANEKKLLAYICCICKHYWKNKG